MDFFSRQAKAIKQTRILVVFFVIALVLITVAVNFIFYLVLATQTSSATELDSWLQQDYWIYISLITFAVIILTSLFRSWQINSNPSAIIKMMEATPVTPSTTNPKQKQLVNLVEEMAIASGMPIPKIYIMKNEQGFNAFVSGLKPSAAILVVTQGLLDNLTRQQLQGVIGHEFSHILNGDMRLNLRLIGVIAGILVLGQIGQVLLRGGRYGSRSTSSKRSEGSAIVFIGLGLFVVGYIGLFFGRIIKAAISRQREFLADASAVQFTRDRNGIAGALLAIKNTTQGSQLINSNAEEMSHMCFGASTKISQMFSGWLASHPPLDDRIQAVYPGFLRQNTSASQSAQTSHSAPSHSSHSNDSDLISQFSNESRSIKTTSDKNHSDIALQIVSTVGTVTAKNIQNAENVLSHLPKEIIEAARGDNPDFSPLVLIKIIFLQATKVDTLSRENFKLLDISLSDQKTIQLIKQLDQIDFKSRNTLFDLALARFENLELKYKNIFFQSIDAFVKNHPSLNPTSLAIYASIYNRLNESKPYQTQINRYQKVSEALNILFSQLLKDNSYEKNHWDNAKQHKQHILNIFGIKLIKEPSSFDPKKFHNALNQLSRLNPLLKQQLILGVTDAIQVDNKIDEMEYSLLRILCEYLDCPIPLD